VTPEPVAWGLAEKMAVRVAGREPFAESYHWDSLQPDFDELTAEAEELVAAATGLRSELGPARARVVDRAGWIRANIASFRRLLRPLTDRFATRLAAGPVAPVSRAVTGAEVGAILGWMSTRVLGQYDLLVVESEHPDDQDVVYYVGTNVLAIEKRYAFPPREFRLWLALHEVTHRAQFTGVPWMRRHFLSLVEGTLSAVDPDPRRFLAALRRAAEELRAGRNPLDEGGIVALFAGPEQREMLQQLQGLMSLLEGHGDVTMNRAGADRIPSAPRFERVLRQRRAALGPVARQLQKLVGMEAKLRQYELGERFVAAVEAAGGRELFDRVWEAPWFLPDLEEVREPARWVARVGAALGTARAAP
jgi:coenzyme F420 biosynthesis associated uncharacterized protein